ncbi:TPA: hypothetical protein DCZ81_01220 [Candidatus Collierbacteria bacterium]|nr:hypothetical protein [Candidatus Collierbacteria bacterium]
MFSNKNLVAKFNSRLKLFISNPKHPLLKNHGLVGRKQGLYSFSVTGDIRVVYRKISDDEIILIDIGTHNQVY